MVQRRAARFIKNDYSRTSSVTNMLKDLKWNTLQERRNQTKLTMLYKIIHGQVDVTPDPPLTPSRSMRGNNQKFRQIRARTTVYQQTFFPSTIVLWNALPQAAAERAALRGRILDYKLLLYLFNTVEGFHTAALVSN